MSKAAFVRSLQTESKALHPFDISQRLRQLHGCVSVSLLDDHLSAKEIRGYMMRYREKPDRSPENPELYICVVSADQSHAWQSLVWAKEILHVLDRSEHRTASKDALGRMLDSRKVLTPNGHETPLNVAADKNGFVLALGSKVPQVYRNALRNAKVTPSIEALENTLLVPAEFIGMLLSEEFEATFEKAIAECDDE